MTPTVYADNNATTQPDPRVVERMVQAIRSTWHNPSARYHAALEAKQALEDARARVARLIGAHDLSRIVFTSGATESNSHAIYGVLRADLSRRRLVTTAVEHPSVLQPAIELAQTGVEVVQIGVDPSGQLDVDALMRALAPGTALVSIMHSNNETGVRFPVGELARRIKAHDPLISVHCDATQSAGKLPIDLQGELAAVDLLSISGHKFHGPKGTGALYIRRGAPCRPLLAGGHQEHERRAGTENVPGIVGLGLAAELAVDGLSRVEETRRLRDRLEAELQAIWPEVIVHGAGAPRLPNTSCLSIPSCESAWLLGALEDHGVQASIGSACSAGRTLFSHVLTAMGVPRTIIRGTVRLSLSRVSTDEEISHIVASFRAIRDAAARRVPGARA